MSSLTTTLANLKRDRVILAYEINDEGTKATVSVATAYQGDDPNRGYDDETQAKCDRTNLDLAALGLRFYDGGFEGLSTESWIYRA